MYSVGCHCCHKATRCKGVKSLDLVDDRIHDLLDSSKDKGGHKHDDRDGEDHQESDPKQRHCLEGTTNITKKTHF